MANIDFKNVALGGVFDRFHEGHKYIIKQAIDRGEKVHIILIKSGDEATHPEKDTESIQPFEVRKEAIVHYLKEADPKKKVSLKLSPEGIGIPPFLAWDIFWTLEDLTWFQVEEDKIVMKIVNLITQQREEKFSLPPLKIEWIPSLKSKSGKKMSSSDLRRKEVGK